MGGAESFCCAGKGWWRCGGCWARAVPLPGGCHSLAECGVFIYYLWHVGLSQNTEGAGGQCWCWWDTGCHQGPTSTCWLCLCPKGGHGCGRWQQEWGRGWWPWDCLCVPSGDTEVARGASLQVSTQRCLQAFLPLPVQLFSLLALAPHLWATGAGRGGEGGPGVPLGRAGDALSLLLPFNKLVFL